jgi:hypothetical protein
MKTTKIVWTFAAVALGVVGLASGQVYSPYAGLYGGSGGYGYSHASTLEEGVLQGYAALTQSTGQANYFHSLAAVNYQQAYSQYLKNRASAVETYFYVKKYNREARQDYAPRRFTTEQLAVLARKAAPERLSEREYDRTIGRVYWPAALQGNEYAAERDALERAFRNRSPAEDGAGSEFYGQVRQLTSRFDEKLKTHLDDLDAPQYVAAKKFLMSLAYEAQQPLVASALALR